MKSEVLDIISRRDAHDCLKAAKGDAKAAKVLFDLLGEQGAAGAGGMQDMDDDPITASLKEEMGNGLL